MSETKINTIPISKPKQAHLYRPVPVYPPGHYYNYAGAVKKDLEALREQYYPKLDSGQFQEFLRTPEGQGFLLTIYKPNPEALRRK